MATREELYNALRNADAAGDTDGARKLAAYIQSMPADAPAEAPKMSDAERIGRGKPSAAVTTAQGPLFGFGDEIAGAIAATVKGIPGLDTGAEGTTWRKRYEGYRDVLRGQEAGYKAENPYTAMGLQAASSLPTMAVTGPVAAGVKGAGMAANALRAALTGGASGAISGAGNSRANSLAGVAEDAAIGGATGAALGGATAPVASALGVGARTVAAKYKGSVADKYAREKIAQQFARDNVTSAQAVNKLQALGPDAVVANAGRDAVLGQLDTLAQLPGATRTNATSTIANMQRGRGARMTGAADEALGAGGRRAAATVEDLVAQRSAEARPLYEKLYKTGVFVNDDLRGIIDAAAKLGATGEAKKVATAAQRDFTLTPETQWVGMRDLDYLKQGLDDIIAASKAPVTGAPTKVTAAVQGLKDRLVSTLDEKTRGAYKVARDAYAGKSAIIDAVNNGRKALTQDDATIGSLTAGMGPSELDGFRVGAFEALRAKLGAQSGQTEMMKLWRQDAMKEKLRAVFGDEQSFLKFARAMHGEREMAKLESIAGGSATARRQFAAGDLDTGALADAGQAVASVGGNPFNTLGLASKVWNKVSTPERVRDAMGNMLLLRGQQGVNALTGMDDLIQRIAEQRAGRAIRTGSILGSAGANQLSTSQR